MGTEPDASAGQAAADDSYRTNGFLFSDLRDYTRYVETHGDEAAAKLLARYRVLVRDAVGRLGGAEIKTEGDSFYVVFPSASGAVRCAVAIAEAAAAPPDGGQRIAVGIGIHAGETVETDEGYVGSAVNIAARICAHARAGEVLVSETVRALTRTLLPVRFEARGRRRLKGISEPIALYAVVPTGGARHAATVPPRRASPVLVGGAAILAIALAGGAAVLFLGGAGQAPPASPTVAPTAAVTSPTAAAQPTVDTTGTLSPTPSPTGFPRTISERRLWEQIPRGYRALCGPSDDPLTGATVSITCPLALGDEADQVWYDRFSGRAEARLALQQLVGRRGLSAGGCLPTEPVGHGDWRVGTFWSGQRACYDDRGAAWIWWTYEDAGIVARVVRRDGGWTRLFDWWNQYSVLFQPER